MKYIEAAEMLSTTTSKMEISLMINLKTESELGIS
jgi:hypothetical protein